MDDNCSGMLRDIEGVQIAAFFKSFGNPHETRISLRSEAPYDVSKVCMRFGGGGHLRAAGATIALPLGEAMKLVIAELEREIAETDNKENLSLR
jgi:bifunctional oligoribonuclease and PAP phosphatase NrnA